MPNLLGPNVTAPNGGKSSRSDAAFCVGHHDDDTEAESGYLCRKCFGRLRHTLRELPAVASWLHANLAAGGSSAGERVGGTREDPIPLRLDVTDLIGPDSRSFATPDPDHLPAFLLWEDGLIIGRFTSWREGRTALIEEMQLAGVEPAIIRLLTRPLTPPWTRKQIREAIAELDPDKLLAAREKWQLRPTERGGTDQRGADAFRALLTHWAHVFQEEADAPRPNGEDITTLTSYLLTHLHWASYQEWIGEFIEDLSQATREAHRVAPWREETKRDKDPCERCGVRAIVMHMSQGRSVCEERIGGCGRIMVWDHQRKDTA